MNYDNLQEAAKQLAVPLERWLEASGNEVMREDIGALKLTNWDARCSDLHLKQARPAFQPILGQE